MPPLVTYPAANTRDSAVALRRVEGIYAKGKSRTNAIEARALVAELVRRLRDPSGEGKSIGVVTLNSEQQRLIEDLLDAERRADGELERFFGDSVAEPVFVKNLETVQGDQRDVILISIGFGPTEPGARTMSMNFGPLNRGAVTPTECGHHPRRQQGDDLLELRAGAVDLAHGARAVQT